MNLLSALFRGAKAIWDGVKHVGRTLIQEVLQELDHSAVGRATTRLLDGVVDQHFRKARNLAEEEGELAQKYIRDGRYSVADSERLDSIRVERDRLRGELEAANAQLAEQELRARAGETLVARLDDDELSSNVGILAAKLCPACGGTMRIQQGAIDTRTEKRKFYWQCTDTNAIPCPTIKLDPEAEERTIVRPSDADLDTKKVERRAIWTNAKVIAETHGRVRQHLGDDDNQLVCPVHLVPMKLLQKRHYGGRVLDSYEYICLGVMPDGRACTHTVALQTMPQVAAMLKRTEGEGIIRE